MSHYDDVDTLREKANKKREIAAKEKKAAENRRKSTQREVREAAKEFYNKMSQLGAPRTSAAFGSWFSRRISGYMFEHGDEGGFSRYLVTSNGDISMISGTPWRQVTHHRVTYSRWMIYAMGEKLENF